MANILKIKRSDNANGNAPTALARGELAYHEVTDTLYIGSGTETGGEAANQPVVAGPLNLMPAPTANVSLNSKKITNLATPTTANDAVNKSYVDAAQTGLDVKGSVRVATTADLGGSWPNLGSSVSIDGVTLSTGDRVLVKDQSTASENGIYRYEQSGSADDFIRATDADNSPAGEVTSGMFTFVEDGSTHANSGFVLSTTGSITLGSTSLAFSQFSGAGQITAGNGLQKVGDTLSVDLKANAGLEINAGEIQVDLTHAGIGSQGDLAVADGGTGASTAQAARTNLGITLANLGYTGVTDANKFAMNVSHDAGTAAAFASGSTLNITGGSGIGVSRSGSSYSLAVDTTSVCTLNATQSLSNKTIDCGTF